MFQLEQNSIFAVNYKEMSKMKTSALALANYFIELAQSNGSQIKPLRLMKLVYIAHGYILAMLGRSALNPRFDEVEAWRYGPVIPSVYHSFKRFGNQPITEKTVIFGDEKKENGDISINIETPELKDKEMRDICEFVWKRYGTYSDGGLVDLLHKPGTPWGLTYKEGMNIKIPDALTHAYYKSLINTLLNVSNA